MRIKKTSESISIARLAILSIILLFSCFVHLSLIGSILSEPFELEPSSHLLGSKTHPVEAPEIKGYWDPYFHDTDRVPRGLDFFSIYQAGYNFTHGMSVYYGVREHSYGPEHLVVPYFSGFRYLPYYAVIYGSLLSLVPPWPSYWMWICTVECLLLLNIAIIWHLIQSKEIAIVLSALWLGFTPYYIELHIGQQSMITVTLLHLTALFHVRSKFSCRDLSYNISVIWKLNTVIFIPIWFKLKRFKSIGTLVVFSLLLSIPYYLIVPGSFAEFSSYFHHKFIAAGPNCHGIMALWIAIWQDAELPPQILSEFLLLWKWSIYIAAIAATIIPRRIAFLPSLAMWICVYFLTYQYVWEHHYILMLPAYSMIASSFKPRFWIIPCILHALPSPYYWFNISDMQMPQEAWNTMQDLLYYGFRPVPVLFLFIVLAIQNIFTSSQAYFDPADNHPQIDLLSKFRRITPHPQLSNIPDTFPEDSPSE